MIIKFQWMPPSKKNSKQVFCRWGRPTVIPSKAYNEWHKQMSESLEWTEKLDNKEYIFLYHFLIPLKKDGEKTKRPFDYSNKIESINDLLVDLWIIEDDNYNFIMPRVMSKKFVPYGEWGVILEIKEITDE